MHTGDLSVFNNSMTNNSQNEKHNNIETPAKSTLWPPQTKHGGPTGGRGHDMSVGPVRLHIHRHMEKPGTGGNMAHLPFSLSHGFTQQFQDHSLAVQREASLGHSRNTFCLCRDAHLPPKAMGPLPKITNTLHPCSPGQPSCHPCMEST